MPRGPATFQYHVLTTKASLMLNLFAQMARLKIRFVWKWVILGARPMVATYISHNNLLQDLMQVSSFLGLH